MRFLKEWPSICLSAVTLLVMPAARVAVCADPPQQANPVDAEAAQWKARTARINITPKKPLCMCGWGGLNREADGTYHDVWIKILALEDAGGHRGVVITADVMGFSKVTYDTICERLKARCGLDRSQVKLTYSHTHTGPLMGELLQDYYPLTKEQWTRVDEYSRWLEEAVVEKVAAALSQMAPATVWATEGSTNFAVNRRNYGTKDVAAIRKRGEPLKGPVDHSIPMLVVRTPTGDLQAVVFGYACHCNTVRCFQWSGDYAGVAQIALEKEHPGAQAMFFAACGADQNPLPRGKVEFYEKYGKMLTTGVEEALGKRMRPVAPTLRTAFEFVELDFQETMTAERLKEHVAKGGSGAPVSFQVYGWWAKRMLKQLDEGKSFATSYPYAVQVWQLGSDQLWVSMGGEVVVDYSLKFKQKYGPTTWVNGFSHDLTAYMPSRRVWDEGGYEAGYLGEYGLPAMRWAPDLEDRITDAVDRLVQKLQSSGQKTKDATSNSAKTVNQGLGYWEKINPNVDYKSRLPRIKPREPDASLKSFQILSDLRIELVAAEPTVVRRVVFSASASPS